MLPKYHYCPGSFRRGIGFSMPDFWLFLALQLVAVLSGAATAVVVLLVGGVGGHLALSRRLVNVEDRQDDLDTKLTTEVKRRAAGAAVASREAKKTVEEEAAELLAAQKGGRTMTRPRVV